MSGHSKWASIKHKKAITDSRRGKLFAKLLRGIEIAAREGHTSNPANDMTLAAAVDRAKQYRVPADTIERAAKRGAGESDEQVTYERVLYEGYAAGGVAVLIEALTENRNRTGAEIRAVFARNNANLGEPGSVAYMFDRRGVITLKGEPSEDVVLDAAAEAGALDASIEDEQWTIVSEAKELASVRDTIKSAGLDVESAELTMLPQTTVTLDGPSARPVLKLMDALDELDDVQAVYTNFDIPEEMLAEVS